MSEAKTRIVFIISLLAICIALISHWSFSPVKASENLIKIFPSSYSIQLTDDMNWENPESVFIQDLSGSASFEEFNKENSAFVLFSDPVSFTTQSIEGVNFPEPIDSATSPKEGIKPVLEFFNFNIGEVLETSEIKNVQLRFSFAGKNNSNVLIEYQKNSLWYNLGGVNITDKDVSNFTNNGYFLYALSVFEKWEDFENLKIRFTYFNEQEKINSEQQEIYLDAVWLEVEYEEKEDNYEYIEEYSLELVSTKKDFKSDETPVFKFYYQKKTNFLEKVGAGIFNFFRSEYKDINIKATVSGLDINPNIRYEENGEIFVELADFKKPRQFKPGRYILKIEIEDDGQIFIQNQEFLWGVLAINVNKSIFFPNEMAYLQMAVLDDNGHTICDANLKLEIIPPALSIPDTGFVTLPIDGVVWPEVQKSGECGPDNVTDVPDYFSYYQTGEPGIYQMKLTNLGNNYEITDFFEVREFVPFEVERIGPTRIYPPATYEMIFKIKANQDFVGQMVEQIPISFEVNSNADIEQNAKSYEDTKEIIWQVDWKKGEGYELKYQFDAPDISPYIYLLGPLKFREDISLTSLFEEVRQWQIAADNVLTNPSFTGGTTGWTLSNMSYDSSTYQDTEGSVTAYAARKASVTGTATQNSYNDYTGADTVTFSAWWKNTHTGNGSSQYFLEIAKDSAPDTWIVIWSTGTLYTTSDWTSTGNINVLGYVGDGSYRLRLRAELTGGASVGSEETSWFDNVVLDIVLPVPSLVVSNVSLNNGSNINLIESSTTSVSSTATTSHPDDYSDFSTIIGKIYRSGVSGGPECSANTNNCYDSISCATSNCGTYSATSCDATCDFEIWFNADPTDGTVSQTDETPWSSEYWVTWIKAIDSSNSSSTATNSSQTVDVGSLLAFDVTTPINYGDNMIPGDKNDPLSETTTVSNTGNCSLDMTLYGVNMESGVNNIAVGNQKYASSSVAYASGASLLVSPGSELELDLPKTTTSSSPETTDIWWGIEIPSPQVVGTYTGTTTFESKVNEVSSW